MGAKSRQTAKTLKKLVPLTVACEFLDARKVRYRVERHGERIHLLIGKPINKKVILSATKNDESTAKSNLGSVKRMLKVATTGETIVTTNHFLQH